MHLVFLNQYYPPDAAPTGVMLEAVVEKLAAQGHDVTVLCSAGGYAGERRKTARRKTQDTEGSQKSEAGGPRSEVRGRRSEIEEERESGEGGRCDDPESTVHDAGSRIRIVRVRASRFGRGTFVGKLFDYLSYYLGVAWRLMWLRPRPDRIVALTTPPYLSVLARVMSKLRGADHGHWIMDIYPDVMVAHGILRKCGWQHRLLVNLARWGSGGSRSAVVLTLGPDMARRMERLMKPRKQPGALLDEACTVDWIPLWGEADEPRPSSIPAESLPADGSAKTHAHHGGCRDLSSVGSSCDTGDPSAGRSFVSLRRQRGWKDKELIVMYSGNMGLGHRFSEILEVAGREVRGRKSEAGNVAAVCDRRGEREKEGRPIPDSAFNIQHSTRWVFFGGGRRRVEIEAFLQAHPEAAVELHDYAPAEILPMHLRSADVHLTTLDAAWTGTMVPSKLQGIFEVARPVIFIGDSESSIGRWVSQSGGGWVVKPGDVNGLIESLNEASNPRVRMLRGRAAKAFAEVHFRKSRNSSRVAEKFAG